MLFVKTVWTPNHGRTVYSVDVDGQNLRPVLVSKPETIHLLLSPDGRFVAVRKATESGLIQLYTMNLDGSNVRALANVAGNCERLQWQPDGE